MRLQCLTMTNRVLFCGLLWWAGCWAQTAATDAASDGGVIKAETKVVLVDAVVTDKKGEYLRDLTVKDFRVWEDNTEQTITSFSLESDASSAKKQTHYMVLFFDNTTMSVSDQMQARQAAGKFIDSNASPDHVMAVVNYGGTLQIAQNFTADKERLKKAVSGISSAFVSAGEQTVDISSSGFPGISGAEMDFAARSGLLALRSMVKSIAALPGRKTLVLLTSGFPVTPEQMPEVTAVINDCNKANVAVYPIDVRGLVVSNRPAAMCPAEIWPCPRITGSEPLLQTVAYSAVDRPAQHAGGGSTGGGGTHSGGSPGGSRSPTPTSPGTGSGSRAPTGSGSSSSYNNLNRLNNAYNRSSLLLPLLSHVSEGQQVLYMLANGTGGFVILNTNDLVSGMQKIARDGNEYYLLGYKPEDSEEGKCHALKVKVDRGGTMVRARTGYCNVPPQDLLSGNPIEKELEKRADGPVSGGSGGSMQAPFFYTSPNRARVNFAMDIPPQVIKSSKLKKKIHAEVNILGVARGSDGKAAARFSDTVKFDFDDKKEFEEFLKQPIHYENQFSIAPGKYTLSLAFESGKDFGKLETPLVVDAWDGKHFSMSGLALSTDMHRVSDVTAGIDADLLADRTPLIAQGVEIDPSGTKRLKKSGIGVLYAEIYEPLLTGATAPRMGVQLRVLDAKTGVSKFDTGLFAAPAPENAQAKNPVVPIGIRLPIDKLPTGSYRVELTAKDSAGQSASRSSEFEIE